MREALSYIVEKALYYNFIIIEISNFLIKLWERVPI